MICAMDITAQRISDLPKSQQPQPAPKANPVQTTSLDSIKFDKMMHDYGTIVQGADGNCEFKFTNDSKTPLILSNVQASCGCTAPEWPKEPIAPGKSSSIKVKYNTALVGVFNKSITVNSNAANSTVLLQIKGNVTPKQN